ncbi:hypothetical protein L2E82_31790 [Cichorium intybus]|uniref:Uncharacterized protein n=1 Tax=Cichorium intybus TaxID=13427 RepID=A0ACB9BG75_CICIN|nr:hypothetical protein L2E82_31790 [Cichorium intybus]
MTTINGRMRVIFGILHVYLEFVKIPLKLLWDVQIKNHNQSHGDISEICNKNNKKNIIQQRYLVWIHSMSWYTKTKTLQTSNNKFYKF